MPKDSVTTDGIESGLWATPTTDISDLPIFTEDGSPSLELMMKDRGIKEPFEATQEELVALIVGN